MSSVMQEAALDEKRGTFFRKSSLQKLKCTAFYPMQVAGSYCGKDSIKVLLETTILSAKQFIQRPVIVVCATLACKVLGRLTGKEVFEKFENHLRACEQVENKSKSYSVIRELKQKQQKSKTTNNGNFEQSRPILTDNNGSEAEVYFDCVDKNKVKEQKRPLISRIDYLTVVVYSCTIFIFAEFLILLYLLQLCHFTMGFAFLFTCLVIIAFITFKISFMRKKENRRRSLKDNQLKTTSKYNMLMTFPLVKNKPIVCVRPLEKPSNDMEVGSEFDGELKKNL